MALNIGIVGLPNVGKSTLFNALTASQVPAENFPFCTIDPSTGIVAIPDPRLNKLVEIYKPKKVTPATVEFVDIAGLVKNASQGEGLGNQFLSHIRQVDCIAHIVRCFEDPNVVHVHGKVDPKEDIEIINTELILADLETVTKRLEKEEKQAKGNDKEAAKRVEILKRIKPALKKGEPARSVPFAKEDLPIVKELCLITQKPVLYVANTAEGEGEIPASAGMTSSTGMTAVQAVRDLAAKEKNEAVVLCGKLEAELSQLSGEEKKEFFEAMGLKEPGLNRLIRSGFHLLNWITYFTAGEKEVRAWPIQNGTKAPQAAGKIHSDFERGFIRAEIFSYDDLIATGSEAQVKAAGKYRSEGKEYVVKDGDIILFRFNV